MTERRALLKLLAGLLMAQAAFVLWVIGTDFRNNPDTPEEAAAELAALAASVAATSYAFVAVVKSDK